MSVKIKRSICITIIILTQCLTVIYWASQKERFNVDEVFSYEGAKSGGYGMQYWDKDKEAFYGQNYTKNDFEEHITIHSGELLIKKPIELLDAFINRNVYYTMLNLAATFTAGKLTKWTGIGLNIVFFVLTQIVLYRFAVRNCSGFRAAVLVVLLYGFSAGGISTVLYMRCYMMLTLLLLIVFCCYMKFIESKDWKQKILYLFLALAGGVGCIKIHQFGMLAFMIMTGGIILYVLIFKRNKYILLAMGGIAVIGGFISILYTKKSTNLVEIFKGRASAITREQLIARSKYIVEIISGHLCFHSLILALIVVLIVYSLIRNRETGEEEKRQRKMGMAIGICICCYLMILILGAALAWKYVCIMYPFICLMWIMLFGVQRISKQLFAVIFVVMFGITGVSYFKKNVSELFLGELEAENFFEENYGDINGVMVNADTAGENWLYEAAYLWPDKAKVNVQLLSTVYEANRLEIPQNEENKILLWLTLDYDNTEVMELFMKKTPFTQCEMVYSTDSLNVYICEK